MSTAHLVPETRDLSGDEAFETLRRTGRRHLMADAFRRLRYSDGFSHARSLAYLSVLIVVQGTIALVGLATALNNEAFSDTVTAAIEGSAPGPSGELPDGGRPSGSDDGRQRQPSRAVPRPRRLSVRGHDGTRPVRAGAEPAVRRRGRPADSAEVRLRVRARRRDRHPPHGGLRDGRGQRCVLGFVGRHDASIRRGRCCAGRSPPCS